MPDYTAYRVDFENVGGGPLCGPPPVVKIKRDFPTNLENLPNFTQSDWDQFCNKIDVCLDPLTQIRRRNARLACFLAAFFFIMLVVAPLVTRFLAYDRLGSNWGAVMFAMLMCPILGFCYLISSSRGKDLKILGELYDVCEESTEHYLGINFVLKRERVFGGTTSKSTRIIKFIEVQARRNDDEERRPRTPDTLSSENMSSGDDHTAESRLNSVFDRLQNIAFQDNAGRV
ncbi:predicted protein [Chaetoceros tenuissimus]|uniref:Uncharacterized protein n=1 Tax=Chaetoceros tenuissimus TaxID=426638 RepID=A0AAD3H4M8_9STRA|nr:predicted protein [Chaetoceros tenuissimus]